MLTKDITMSDAGHESVKRFVASTLLAMKQFIKRRSSSLKIPYLYMQPLTRGLITSQFVRGCMV